LMDPAATSALSGLKTNDVTSSQLTTRKTLLPSLLRRKPKNYAVRSDAHDRQCFQFEAS
jgi:hypothetical protein